MYEMECIGLTKVMMTIKPNLSAWQCKRARQYGQERAEVTKTSPRLSNQNILARSVYDTVRHTGTQQPRIYDLPKTHKDNILLTPSLLMIGSSQHELANLLTEILASINQSITINHKTYLQLVTYSSL